MTSSQYPESNSEGDSLHTDPDSDAGATSTDREAAGEAHHDHQVESYSTGIFDQGHQAEEPGEGVFDQGHPEPPEEPGQGVFDQGHPEHKHRHGQGVYEQGHSDHDDPEQDVPDDTDSTTR
jgi:hypothetical protein